MLEMLSRFVKSARIALSGLLIAASCLATVAALADDTVVPRAGPLLDAAQPDARELLVKFGNFVPHDRYGEVWVPTATPQGWHPYPPCQWVRSRKYGWFYDDKSPWGAIIHHYGRWAHDPQMGWVWLPGNEFSPGWVVWRSSTDYIGWAPMLPEQEVQAVTTETFDKGDQWLFMDTPKFGKPCSGDVLVPAPQVPVILEKTTYVTQIAFVNGIVIFLLPSYVTSQIVDVEVNFTPWPVTSFTQFVSDWNWVWHKTLIHKTLKVCTPSNPAGK